MTAVLVVDLPRMDCRMVADRLRQLRYDLLAFDSIPLMRKTVVSPRTERPRQAILIKCDHVGHRVNEPLGRACRWRSYHRRKPRLVNEVEESLQPGKIVALRFGFETAPSEFSYTNESNSEIVHSLQILRPTTFNPMFRVIADAERRRRRVLFFEHREVRMDFGQQRRLDCPPTRLRQIGRSSAVIFPSSFWRPLKLLPEWPLRLWPFRMLLSWNSRAYPSEEY